ncbi:hypothetical protein GCM10027269_40260 [Kribbella endophytica]
MLSGVTVNDWLPGPLASQLVDRLGQPVTDVQPASGTFASDFAAVLTLKDASTVFVKASSDRARRADYEVESLIGGCLPTGLFTPKLRGWLTRGRWIVLWFDAVSGAPPVQPWQSQATDAVVAALSQHAVRLTPSPVPLLRTMSDMIAETGAFTVWNDLLAGRPRAVTKSDLDSWALSNLEQLAELEARWPIAVAGETLCHFDPRADNFLIDRDGRAWVVDWSRGCVGARWVDIATLAVTLAADGYDAERILERGTDRTSVDPNAVNAHLAALAGYWSNAIRRPRAGRDRSLLDYQQRSAAGALAWLQHRLEASTGLHGGEWG